MALAECVPAVKLRGICAFPTSTAAVAVVVANAGSCGVGFSDGHPVAPFSAYGRLVVSLDQGRIDQVIEL